MPIYCYLEEMDKLHCRCSFFRDVTWSIQVIVYLSITFHIRFYRFSIIFRGYALELSANETVTLIYKIVIYELENRCRLLLLLLHCFLCLFLFFFVRSDLPRLRRGHSISKCLGSLTASNGDDYFYDESDNVSWGLSRGHNEQQQ